LTSTVLPNGVAISCHSLPVENLEDNPPPHPPPKFNATCVFPFLPTVLLVGTYLYSPWWCQRSPFEEVSYDLFACNNFSLSGPPELVLDWKALLFFEKSTPNVIFLIRELVAINNLSPVFSAYLFLFFSCLHQRHSQRFFSVSSLLIHPIFFGKQILHFPPFPLFIDFTSSPAPAFCPN